MSDTDPNEFEIRAGPLSGRARGTDAIATVMFLLGVIGLGMLYIHMTEAKAGQQEIVLAMQRVAESYTELSYLMTLSPEARAKLNLEMPESMRRRLRER